MLRSLALNKFSLFPLILVLDEEARGNREVRALAD